jgi:HEAT repeat protein/MFS family permease
MSVEPNAPPDAPKELNRLEVLQGLRIATWEASFATVWATLTTGIFMTGFALWLGANNAFIGLMTAIPTFAGLIQVVSSYFTERLTARKPITAWFSLLGRGLWLPILLLPFLMERGSALYPFLFLLAASYVCLNIPLPAYMSWMSDLVPADHRGRYFGRRNMVAGVVGMVLGLPAAWFLDFTTKRHAWGEMGFSVLFGLGLLGGILSFICLRRQPEPPMRRSIPTEGQESPQGLAGILAYYKTPFTDKNFVRLLTFNVVFGLGQNFAAPFYMVYALKNLNIDNVWLQIFATLTSVSSLTSMPLWGYLSDRFGNKPLLAIGALGTFTLPLYWIIVNPTKPGLMFFLLTLLNLSGGLAWAGVQLTQFNLLISMSPPQKTPIYVATMSAITGVTGGLAPLVGSMVMTALVGWSGNFLGIHWLNFHVVFFISAFLRLFGLVFLRKVDDPRAATTKEVLHQLRHASPRTWQNIRRMQRGGDEEIKLRATEELAVSKAGLAVSELELALHDPSPAVRMEAAHALGEIGEATSLEALLATLEDPASGIVEEVARAIGRIGDRRAVPELARLLRDEERLTRRRERIAVVQALGDLGGFDAARILLEEFEESQDTEVREAVARAFGEVGERFVVPVLLRVLEEEPPRSLLLALVRTLGELGDTTVLPALRKFLSQTPLDTLLLPTLADALARLEDTDSLVPLLACLNQLRSPVARKQVAVAISQLVGEKESLYPLLSQEAFAREAGASRLLQEVLRRLKSVTDIPEAERLLETYVSGEYGEFKACAMAMEPHFSEESKATMAGRLFLTLCAMPELALEEALLVIIAMRACLVEERAH